MASQSPRTPANPPRTGNSGFGGPMGFHASRGDSMADCQWPRAPANPPRTGYRRQIGLPNTEACLRLQASRGDSMDSQWPRGAPPNPSGPRRQPEAVVRPRVTAGPKEGDQSNESLLHYSRACPICFAENPPERAVFTQCGHTICNKCADAYSGQICVICRATSGLVKLFEEEGNDELYDALIEENRALKKRLTEYIEENRSLNKRLTECIKEHQAMQDKHRDACNTYEEQLHFARSETAFIEEKYCDLQRKHLDDFEEYESTLGITTEEIRLLRKQTEDCSCLGQPSVNIEKYQAMLDEHRVACEAYDASLKLERSQTAEEIRSLKEQLADLQRKHHSDYIEYERKQSVKADEIRSLEKQLADLQRKHHSDYIEYERKQSEKADEIRSLEKQLAECNCDDTPSVPLWKYEELLKQHQAMVDTLLDGRGTRGDEERLHQEIDVELVD